MNPLPVDLLLLSIATPLAAALVIALGLPRKPALFAAYIGFAAPALASVWCWLEFSGASLSDGYAFRSAYDVGLGHIGIRLALGLNGVAMPLFALAGIVGFAAGFYALQSGAERLRHYLLLLLVMQGGLMGVFASVDIFFFYFFHELALIPTFIMVGVWGGRDRNYAAMKMTIYLTLGAMLSLAGIIALYQNSGAQSFDLVSLRAAIAAQPLTELAQKNIFALLMFGFGVLVSLWPLHTWAPLGYAAAPTSAAMLHAGVLKKFGLYGLLQIALPLLPAGAENWTCVLAWLALANVLVIGLVTVAQSDLKQMLGYSSVMHMGYAFLGLASLGTLGAGAVVMLMVGHGFSVALLFLLASCIQKRTRTLDMAGMGGLVKDAPVLAAFFVAATLASAGLPGFANFWGELGIFVAMWGAFEPWFVALAVLGIIISAIYGLRSAARIFFGPRTAAFEKTAGGQAPSDLHWGEKVPALVLLIALLLIGFWPKSISTAIDAELTSANVTVTVARADAVAAAAK